MALLNIKFFNHFNNKKEASLIFNDILQRFLLIDNNFDFSENYIDRDDLFELIIKSKNFNLNNFDFMSVEDICLSFEVHCSIYDTKGYAKSFFYDEIDGWVDVSS